MDSPWKYPGAPRSTGRPPHFDGWAHYEQGRPALPGETIEVIARWPDQGYTPHYRPVLDELTQARHFPIDPLPAVTVLGRLDENDLPELRSLAAQDHHVDQLSRAIERMAKTDRAILAEPAVSTGSIIPSHTEIPVHYAPAAGRWLDAGLLIHEDHPSAAYAVAAEWGSVSARPSDSRPLAFLCSPLWGWTGYASRSSTQSASPSVLDSRKPASVSTAPTG